VIKGLKLWCPVVLWCGVIYTFSSIPNLRIEALGFWDLVLRKVAHAVEFAILAILLQRAMYPGQRTMNFWPLFLTFVYAVSDEYHQYFVPGRYTAATDVLIDTVGGVLGLLTYGCIIKKKVKFDNPQERLKNATEDD
jgi:VanZ family protein